MRHRPVALAGHDLTPRPRQLVGPIRLTDTLDRRWWGGLAGRGRRAGIYGALLLAVYDQDADRFQTICRCGTGFSDAELAGLPARLAPELARVMLARALEAGVPAGWVTADEVYGNSAALRGWLETRQLP